MSDIRLKKITIETSGSLEINKGNIYISSTSVSTSKLQGALVIDGGISINNTVNSSSSTCGGSITLGGGIGISKNAFIGQNLTMDSNSGIFRIQGILEDRFLLQDVSGKNLSISVDGIDKQFEITDQTISVLCTGDSSIVTNGGIRILGTTDSENSTSGALTISGGLGILKDANFGNNVFIESVLYTDNIESTSLTVGSTNGIVFESTIGNLNFKSSDSSISLSNSGVQVSKNIEIFGNGSFTKSVTVLDTTQATNASTASVIILGGLGVQQDTYINGDIYTERIILGSSGNYVHTNTSGYLEFVSSSQSSLVITQDRLDLPYWSIESTVSSLTFESKQTAPSIISMYSNVKVYGDSTSESLLISKNFVETTSQNFRLVTPLSEIQFETSGNLIMDSKNVIIQSTEAQSIKTFGGMVIDKNLLVTGNVSINTSSSISQITSGSMLFQNGTGVFKFDGKLNLGQTSYTDSFITSGNLYSVNEKLFINTLGNIGINNSSPTVAFQVNGYSVFNESTTVESLLVNTSTTISNGIHTLDLTVSSNANVISNLNVSGSSSVIGSNVVSGGSYLYGNSNFYSNILATDAIGTFGSLCINSTQSSFGLDIKGRLNTDLDALFNGSVRINGESNFYDSLYLYKNDLKSFSIDNNVDFSISRYNNSGVLVQKSLEISHSTGSFSVNENSFFNESITVSKVVTFNSGANLFGDIVSSRGNVKIMNTTYSSNFSTGALVVSGGVGILGNMNILGDVSINGDVTISGTTNSFYSINTLISDNVVSINSGPNGSLNSGILVERYQLPNDNGEGDLVADTDYISFTLPSQSGMSSVEIKLPAGASSVDNFYTNHWVKIASGFSVDQVRKITGYSGSLKIATIDSNWTSQNPSLGDIVYLYDKPFVGFVWDELFDEFKFGSTLSNPANSNIELTKLLPLSISGLKSNGILLEGDLEITSTSSNSIVTLGGISADGPLVISGVNITPNASDIVSTTSFTANNNASNEILVNFNSNNVWGFDTYISTRLNASEQLYSNYHLRGVSKNNSWELVQSYVGDSILSFTMNTSGDLLYSTPNYSGFVDLIFKYKIVTN